MSIRQSKSDFVFMHSLHRSTLWFKYYNTCYDIIHCRCAKRRQYTSTHTSWVHEVQCEQIVRRYQRSILIHKTLEIFLLVWQLDFFMFTSLNLLDKHIIFFWKWIWASFPTKSAFQRNIKAIISFGQYFCLSLKCMCKLA